MSIHCTDNKTEKVPHVDGCTCLDVTAVAPETSIPKDSDNFLGTAKLYSRPFYSERIITEPFIWKKII